ncbi:uncharacterized protein LOC131247080 [Magnolia sinica]|uniref:uncharacterized protein LOC131247080 n=1 Tax=Magnolia sinica TaxID=86752 RepID=UPI002659916D|nr:uncharacterized protein LOC131247080 [Magnolia sinica]
MTFNWGLSNLYSPSEYVYRRLYRHLSVLFLDYRWPPEGAIKRRMCTEKVYSIAATAKVLLKVRSYQRAGSHSSAPAIRSTTQEEVRQVVTEIVREHEHINRFRYKTPYLREVEDIPFPANFKHPDFQKFNGDGSSDEHLMHFITIMGNFSTVPQYCLRLFGSSLTRKVFRWYSSLAPTWEQMQDAFMSKIFSLDHDISIIELASVRQREGEPVEKFIDIWRTLGASCRQLPKEKEQVKMFLNSMETGIAFGLTSVDIKTFRDLATKAHALELMTKKMPAFHYETSRRGHDRLMANVLD